MNDFQDFIKRIQLSKENNAIDKSLSKVLSLKSLNKIYDYFLYEDSNSSLKNMLMKIKELKSPSALRITKESSKLPRTLTILRPKMGEYKLIVETNNRLENDSKINSNNASGSRKKGKNCWRVDGKQVEYYNLVSNINYQNDLERVKGEYNISNLVASNYTNIYDFGILYKNKKNSYKIGLYAPKAPCDLNTLLKFVKNTNLTLSKDQGFSLILDLLNGVKILHEQNIIHQDLKSKNILIYIDNDKYRLKLTDYDVSEFSKERDTFKALASYDYASPEIFYFYSDKNSDQHTYYHVENTYATLGKSLFSIYEKSEIKKETYQKPHVANDIWALGIVIFEIMTGHRPSINDQSKINKNPLLKGLLEVDREKRINIDKAIKIFEKVLSEDKNNYINHYAQDKHPVFLNSYLKYTEKNRPVQDTNYTTLRRHSICGPVQNTISNNNFPSFRTPGA